MVHNPVHRGVKRPPSTFQDRVEAGDWVRLGFMPRYRIFGSHNDHELLIGIVTSVTGHGRHGQVAVGFPDGSTTFVERQDVEERAYVNADGCKSHEGNGPGRVWAWLHANYGA